MGFMMIKLMSEFYVHSTLVQVHGMYIRTNSRFMVNLWGQERAVYRDVVCRFVVVVSRQTKESPAFHFFAPFLSPFMIMTSEHNHLSFLASRSV